MKENFKWTIAFLFFLLAGIVLGTVIARICSGVPYLGWLAYDMSVGIDTGFTLSVNAAQIICVIAALITYNKTCKGL